MKLVVDAMAAEFGGIQTYVSNLLRTWPHQFPTDELHVVIPFGSSHSYPGVVEHRVHVIRPEEFGRPVAQLRHINRLVAELGADAVLATLPSTTLVKPKVPMVVVVYDMRHELRPKQFSRARRTMRRISYGRGYRIADGIVAISQRSLDDLHRLHPETARLPGSVVHLGGDHVRSWPRTPRSDVHMGRESKPSAVAFAHQSNKNIELVLQSWGTLVSRDPESTPELLLLGASAATRSFVEGVRHSLGLGRHLRVSPFLPDDQFAAVMATSKLIVFPSDFEGFGLPVVEAMQLGIPVVVGPEPAVLEVAGGHATVMTDWTAEALTVAVRTALTLPSSVLEQAKEYAEGFTWARTTQFTRQAVEVALLG